MLVKMKQHNTIIMAAIAAALTFSFSSCEDDESSTAAAVNLTGITIGDVAVEIGQTASIVPTYAPVNADIKQVMWESSDESVVAIDGAGNVTPLKVGSATITAKSAKFQSISASCKVTVKPAALRFNLNGGKGTLPPEVSLTTKETAISLPAGDDLTKDTCDFLGWSSTKNGDVLKEFKATKTDTLWAVWKHREWADLGLSSKTLWAYDNLDGKYAWGETASKGDFSWNNYSLDTCIIDTVKTDASTHNTFVSYTTKYLLRAYCNIDEFAKDNKSDNLTVLKDENDAVYNNPQWKKNWATPTNDQIQELLSQCYWVWTDDYNGTEAKGYIVYKAKNDADKGMFDGTPTGTYASADNEKEKTKADIHIFLPVGKYWSSSLNTTDPYHAFGLNIEEKDGTHQATASDDDRFNGFLIRPVKK